MVGQLQELFVADARQAEDLDGGERPERFLLLEGEVPASAGGSLLGPGEVSRGLGRDGSAKRSLGAGDHRPWLGGLRSPEQLEGREPAAVGGADQHGEHGKALAGALIHPCLAVLALLGLADLVIADRAAYDPRSPAGRFLRCPVGEV